MTDEAHPVVMKPSELVALIDRNFAEADRCWDIEQGRSRWKRFRDALSGRDVRDEVIACVENIQWT